MLPVLMAAFALAISVAALAGVLWTTYALLAGEKAQDSKIAALLAAASETMPQALAARVDGLEGALDVIRASNRKEFGSLWGRLGGRRPNEGQLVHAANDDNFEALLDLQNKPPAGPQ